MFDDYDNHVWSEGIDPTPQVITLDELEDLLHDAILEGSAPDSCRDDIHFAEIDDYFAQGNEECKVQQQKSYLRLAKLPSWQCCSSQPL